MGLPVSLTMTPKLEGVVQAAWTALEILPIVYKRPLTPTGSKSVITGWLLMEGEKRAAMELVPDAGGQFAPSFPKK